MDGEQTRGGRGRRDRAGWETLSPLFEARRERACARSTNFSEGKRKRKGGKENEKEEEEVYSDACVRIAYADAMLVGSRERECDMPMRRSNIVMTCEQNILEELSPNKMLPKGKYNIHVWRRVEFTFQLTLRARRGAHAIAKNNLEEGKRKRKEGENEDAYDGSPWCCLYEGEVK